MGQRGAVGAPEPTNMSGMYSALSIPILKAIRNHGRSLSGHRSLFKKFPRTSCGGEQVADFSELSTHRYHPNMPVEPMESSWESLEVARGPVKKM